MKEDIKTIDLEALASVCGGMRYTSEDRESTHVEDRRGMSYMRSLRKFGIKPLRLPRIERHPGDLPSQLGIDAIRHHHARWVQSRRGRR